MIRRRRPLSGNGGFTLIELMIVMVIIAILVTLLVVSAVFVRRRAQIMSTQGTLQRVSLALSEYHNDFNDYPQDEDFDWLWKGNPDLRDTYPGKHRTFEGRLVGPYLNENSLSFAEDDADKDEPLDAFQRPITYERMVPTSEQEELHAVLKSPGPDENDPDDDIVQKVGGGFGESFGIK